MAIFLQKNLLVIYTQALEIFLRQLKHNYSSMKKNIYTVFIGLLALFVSSCECETYKCPAFYNHGNWLLDAERVDYVEASGSEVLSLVVTDRRGSNAYGENASTLTFNCKSDCITQGGIDAATPVGSAPKLNLNISSQGDFSGNKLQTITVNYTLAGMSSTFQGHPELQRQRLNEDDNWQADSINRVNTGTVVYPSVLVQTRKAGADTEVVKTYWVVDRGLIGFALGDGRIFWRR